MTAPTKGWQKLEVVDAKSRIEYIGFDHLTAVTAAIQTQGVNAGDLRIWVRHPSGRHLLIRVDPHGDLTHHTNGRTNREASGLLEQELAEETTP